MVFPDTTRVVYEVETLDQVICQLQYPPILAIGTDPPSPFQERIRAEYPLYERAETMPFPPDLAKVIEQLPVKPPQTVSHKFLTDDRARFIELTPESIAVVETTYTEWADLRAEIDRAKAALEEIYRPAFYSRIGLRYQDAIDRDRVGLGDTPWADLLNSSLAGLLGADREEIRGAVKEVTSTAVLDFPGVQGGQIRLQSGLARPSDGSPVVYLIDGDYSATYRYEGEAVSVTLDHLNREAGNVFRWAISPILQDALGDRDLNPDPIGQ